MLVLTADPASGHLRTADQTTACNGRTEGVTPAGNCIACLLAARTADTVTVLHDAELVDLGGYAADICAATPVDRPGPATPQATWQFVRSQGSRMAHIAVESLLISHADGTCALPAATTLCGRAIAQPVDGHIDPPDRCVTCAQQQRKADGRHVVTPPAEPMTEAVVVADLDPVPRLLPHQRLIAADITTNGPCAALTAFWMPSLDGTTVHAVEGAPKLSGKGPPYITETVHTVTACTDPRSTMLGGCARCADTIKDVARSAAAEWHLHTGPDAIAIAVDGTPVPIDVLTSGGPTEPCSDPLIAGRWRPDGHGHARLAVTAVARGRSAHLTWSTWAAGDTTGRIWDATPATPARTLCGKPPETALTPPTEIRRWCTQCGQRMASILGNPGRLPTVHPGIAIGATLLSTDAADLPLPILFGLLQATRPLKSGITGADP